MANQFLNCVVEMDTGMDPTQEAIMETARRVLDSLTPTVQGLARLGVMRMKEPSGASVLGIYGNVRIPRGGQIPPALQSADAIEVNTVARARTAACQTTSTFFASVVQDLAISA